MITRYYVNTKTPCVHLVIDRQTDMNCGVHSKRPDAEKERDRLNAQWNAETQTTTISTNPADHDK